MLAILLSFNPDGDMKHLGELLLIALAVVVMIFALLIGGLVWLFSGWLTRRRRDRFGE